MNSDTAVKNSEAQGNTTTATDTSAPTAVVAKPVEAPANGNLPIVAPPADEFSLAINLFDTNACLNSLNTSKRWGVKVVRDKENNVVGAAWKPQTDREVRQALVAAGRDSSKAAIATVKREDSVEFMRALKTWIVSMPDDALGLAGYRSRVTAKGVKRHTLTIDELERIAQDYSKLAEAFGFTTVDQLMEHLKKTTAKAPTQPPIEVESTKTTTAEPPKGATVVEAKPMGKPVTK